jgi:hypothetical protein
MRCAEYDRLYWQWVLTCQGLLEFLTYWGMTRKEAIQEQEQDPFYQKSYRACREHLKTCPTCQKYLAYFRGEPENKRGAVPLAAPQK